MKRAGEPPDEAYVLARRGLLDALEALGDQRDAVVLVGAQAIYLHTGEADIAVAPFTNDGDLMLDPVSLLGSPLLEDAMRAGGFDFVSNQPGRWRNRDSVIVDLLVPESLGGKGRRGARLGKHGGRAARKARGLEGALVDRQRMCIPSLQPRDSRVFEINVAGPAALLVAKAHKIWERRETPARVLDKDAHDVFRLLRFFPTEELAAGFGRLTATLVSAKVSMEALNHLKELFVGPRAHASTMLRRFVGSLEDPQIVIASCGALVTDLLAATRG